MKVGEKVPDFELPAADGTLIRLSDVYAQRVAVVYFYPKDETPGCTAEACAFRDSYEDFKAAGAEVIGISADNGKAHEKFTEKFRLPFLLLTDKGGAVAKTFGVKKIALGLIPGRETFIIDRDGIIRHHFVSLTRATDHVSQAIDVVKRLAGASGAESASA